MGVLGFHSAWNLADSMETIDNSKCLIVSAASKSIDELPLEFFSHELLSCNPSDDFEILEFAKRWGLPFHPLRLASAFDPWTLLRRGAVCSSESYDTYRAACKKTDHAARFVESQDTADVVEIVSIEEARLSVGFMQSQVDALFASIEGRATMRQKRLVVQINATTRAHNLVTPFFIDASPVITPNGSRPYLPIESQGIDFVLANAIANQIIETCHDALEWKKCRWCGNQFKRKRSKTKWGRTQETSIYCCDKCLQAMKDYRKDKRKNPPSWWTPEQAETERAKGKRGK